MFWLLGNLSGVRWPDVVLAIPTALTGVAICFCYARHLDAFSFGAESAASLGIPVKRTRGVLIGRRNRYDGHYGLHRRRNWLCGTGDPVTPPVCWSAISTIVCCPSAR